MACVIKDEVIESPIEASTVFVTAVAPGYLATLSKVTEAAVYPIHRAYLILVSGNTATSYELNSFSIPMEATCTKGGLSLGNIWYDRGAGAFFYTYGLTRYMSADCSTYTTSLQVYLRGHYVNGTPYWAAPGLPLDAIVASTAPYMAVVMSYIMGGGDNWLNSSNIYVVYKDMTASPQVTYYSNTVKDPSTTAGGTFSVLVSDDEPPAPPRPTHL